MSLTDWIVLGCTLLAIVAYGVWKSGSSKNIDQYLGNRSLPWYHVGLSVMATQASAITFLSAPGDRPIAMGCALCSSISACPWP